MLIISHQQKLLLDMITEHDAKFDDSQRLRIQAIASLNEAGRALIAIRDLIRIEKAKTSGSVETDLGTFNSFEDFLKSGAAGVKKTQAYSYIALAENWDIVLKLGMQDVTNSVTLSKSMRLCRTLKIIDWYKEEKAKGRPESELTVAQYWLDLERPVGPSKRELQLEVNWLNEEVSRLKKENDKLKQELQRFCVTA